MSFARSLAVTLPGGFEVGGTWRRRVELLPLSGEDEAFLFDGLAGLPAARTSALLGRCFALEPGGPPMGAERAAALTVGDREALLLHLRRATFGERLQAVLQCPACGEKLDLDLEVSALLVPPRACEGAEHELELEAEGRRFKLRFRLPTGADQEWVAGLAAEEPEAAVAALLERCLLACENEAGKPLDALSPVIATALSARMAELEPQAEIDLGAACPACGESFSSLLDVGAYFAQELSEQSDRLWREVHLLAWHYHWSEREILALPARKRRRYLRFVAEAQGEEAGL